MVVNVKYSDLFDIKYGQREYTSKAHLIPNSGSIPLISSSGLNNGLYGKFDIEPRYSKVISVARTGSVGHAFYHNYPCCIDDNCLVMTPLIELSDQRMIFYAMAITNNRFRFMYGRQVTPARLGSLEAPEVPDWVDKSKLLDISNAISPVLKKSHMELSIKEWKSFSYGELFEIKKGERLTKQNMKPGNTPFIGSSDSNNGVTGYISRAPKHDGNTISVSYNGSVAEAFYQPEPYLATDDVNILYPKFTLNPYIALFLITLIKKEKYRYNYGRKWHLGRMRSSQIQLPVTENDTERHVQYFEPKGVIAAITPWNFPFLNVPFQAGQALIAGNAVVIKPSEEVVLFTVLLKVLIDASDLPKGVFIPIVGDGKVGETLVTQPVDAILFTGSTATGQRITELAAPNSVPVLTEMGGSAPGIVFEDADVGKVIDMLADMRFDNTGQYCDGLKRLLVHKSKYQEVLDGLKNYAATTKVGDPMDEDTKIGPLVAKRQLDKLEDQVEDALNKGAKVLVGGKRPEGLKGAFYELTVLTDVNDTMKVWKEEVFGPVLPVTTFDSEEEAIKLANDTMYGLGGFIYTEDIERFRRVAAQLKTGSIACNTALYFSPLTPFGGYKKSGNGRSQGLAGFHEVTQIKVLAEPK